MLATERGRGRPGDEMRLDSARAVRRRIGQRVRRARRVAGGLSNGAYDAAARRAFPVVDGPLAVRGLSDRVDVIRDRHGVPHVFATNEADALFGQGLVHAQGRLFQLDGARRLAAGRLAAIAGPELLSSDRFMRRLGLEHLARRDVEALEPGDRALVEAYADGVNEGVRTLPALPPEFTLVGYEPEPWRPEDTMLVGRLVLFGFAVNWDTELQRERLAAALGPAHAAALDPVQPVHAPTATGKPQIGAAERLLAAYEAAVAAGLPMGGRSNAWAVAGTRSRTGAPLLASDPHVPASVPGLFHVSHIRGGDLDVIGADIPGVPGVEIGHNQRMAWGITAGLANVADCYVEQLHPEYPHRYRTPGGWVDAEVRLERIEVRGGEPVEEEVLVTRHGPVIGPALPGEERAIALRSTALEAGQLVRGYLGIAHAQDVESFERAADAWSGTTFNLVFAHVDGSIGYRLVGSVPRAEPGEGLLPRDGATSPGPPPPFEARELPRVVRPVAGYVVSANQAPGGDIELGEEWTEPKRAERIAQLIEATPQHSVASFAHIQVDRYSDHLVRLRDLLLARGAVAEPEGSILARWDGQLISSEPAAAVIGLTYEELAHALTERIAGPLAPIVLGAGLGTVNAYSSFVYRLQGAIIGATVAASAPWYMDVAERDRRLVGAVTRAVERLRERFGDDPARWRWGAVHPLVLDHPMRSVPVIGRWFSRGTIEYGGDVNTVWQAASVMHDREAPARVTPGYRQVIDLIHPDRSTFILLTGNSGIPGHPRYDDCLPDFLAGRQRPLLYSRSAVEAAAESWLVLRPRSADPVRREAAA